MKPRPERLTHRIAMMPIVAALTVAALVLLSAMGCDRPEAGMSAAVEADTLPALKEVFDGAFLIGAALNPGQFTEFDAAGARLVKKHFNTITAENVLKWAEVHPEPDRYDFEQADQFVDFSEANDMFIVGHTLVWHNQTPRWVFEDENGERLGREVLLERMHDHIQTVVGRYRGRIHGWDVVNEALNEDGTLRQSPWLQIIGEDYIEQAFRWAHEADPDAELYYNDYSLENPAKRDGAVRLVRRLLDAGIPVAGIGTQAHHLIDPNHPTVEAQAAAIDSFAALGVDVMITEMDIAVLPRPQQYWGADITQSAELSAELNPFSEGLPDSVQVQLAQRYADLFDVFLQKSDKISRVTLWGVRDTDSWLNNWPIRGRTTYPLLFDGQGRPKPAFHAVVAAARRPRAEM